MTSASSCSTGRSTNSTFSLGGVPVGKREQVRRYQLLGRLGIGAVLLSCPLRRLFLGRYQPQTVPGPESLKLREQLDGHLVLAEPLGAISAISLRSGTKSVMRLVNVASGTSRSISAPGAWDRPWRSSSRSAFFTRHCRPPAARSGGQRTIAPGSARSCCSPSRSPTWIPESFRQS